MFVCVRACVRVYVRAGVRACVRVYVRACAVRLQIVKSYVTAQPMNVISKYFSHCNIQNIYICKPNGTFVQVNTL